eukprot:g32200.t1
MQTLNMDQHVQLEETYAKTRDVSSTLFGNVFLGRDPATRQPVAVKQSSFSLRKEYQSRMGPLCFEDPQREARILKSLHAVDTPLFGQKHIIQNLADGTSGDYDFLVMPYARNGDLFTKVQQAGRFPETVALRYLRQILGALAFMHSEGVAHLDLSLENILLDGETVLLSDFGQASSPADGSLWVCNRPLSGKQFYRSIEAHGDTRKGFNAAAADVWSAGAILFILLTGSPLYLSPEIEENNNLNLRNVLKDGAQGFVRIFNAWGLKNKISDNVCELLAHMICPAAKRATAQMCLNHVAFESIKTASPPSPIKAPCLSPVPGSHKRKPCAITAPPA